MTLRIGFLGAGFITRTHRFFLRRSPVDHRIVAVHDPEEDRARAMADRRGAEVMGEEELLDSVDVVFVASWTSEHARLVRMAAERGVAVFCEKPLAVDARTAQTMVDAVEAAGVASHVGLVLRALPQFRYARHLIDDPRAGRLMTIVFRDDQFIPVQGYYESNWRADPARCGRGTLLEHSIHDVDIMAEMAGPISAVNGQVREFHDIPAIDDLAVATTQFRSGGVGSLTSVWHDMTDRPSQRHVEVFCERLHISLDGTPVGPLTWQFVGEPPHALAGDELGRACVGAGLGRAGDLVDVDGGSMFNPLTPFLEAVVNGAPPPLPLREALSAHRVVDAIYASAADGGREVRPEVG